MTGLIEWAGAWYHLHCLPLHCEYPPPPPAAAASRPLRFKVSLLLWEQLSSAFSQRDSFQRDSFSERFVSSLNLSVSSFVLFFSLGRRQNATGIQAAMSGADLIISHAGAGSIIESLGLGA